MERNGKKMRKGRREKELRELDPLPAEGPSESGSPEGRALVKFSTSNKKAAIFRGKSDLSHVSCGTLMF